jgi:hypothetical protein
MVTHFDNQLNLVLPVCTPTYKSDVNKHKEYDRWPNLQHMLEITSVFIANSSVRGSTSKILSACRYQNPPPRHGPLGVTELGEDHLNADLAGLLRCHLHVVDHHRLVRLVVQRRCTHPPTRSNHAIPRKITTLNTTEVHRGVRRRRSNLERCGSGQPATTPTLE